MKQAAILMGIAALAIAPPVRAQPLKPGLAGLSFLVGDWSNGRGRVAETGGTSTGRSRIEPVAGGGALLRRDHTDLFEADGKPAGAFDQVMLIYPEGGTIRADYSDGEHVIHYVTANVEAGRAVTFTSADQPGAPTFRLAYALAAPGKLEVAFSMAPPGSAAFRPIATGALRKSSP